MMSDDIRSMPIEDIEKYLGVHLKPYQVRYLHGFLKKNSRMRFRPAEERPEPRDPSKRKPRQNHRTGIEKQVHFDVEALPPVGRFKSTIRGKKADLIIVDEVPILFPELIRRT